MHFVIPSRDAGCLHHAAHGAAVVGAVAQKSLYQLGVARHKATAQAGYIAALGQAGEAHQIAKICAPRQHRGF